jgi:hypothetical protein
MRPSASVQPSPSRVLQLEILYRAEIETVGGSGSAGEVVCEPTRAGQVATMVRTLLGTGFVLEDVKRKATYLLFACHRYDEFGILVPYVVVLTDRVLSGGDAGAIQRYARMRGARPVVVGPDAPAPLTSVPWDSFIARFGGPVRSWLPLEPDYPRQLIELGHNRPVEGLAGRVDDLFEEFVHVGLLFLLANRVIRYGQQRRFEVLPDGAGFAGRDAALFLYDAKAYGEGYPVERDSIRQFADYVKRFHQRYETHVGRVHTFLVVSGHFAGPGEARRSRSDELYDECGVRLSFMTADALGAAVGLLAQHPTYRNVLPWRSLLSRLDVTVGAVERELAAVQRDGLVKD